MSVIAMLDYLKELYGYNFPDKYLREAFTQDENRNLAELGDSILDLVIYEYAYNLKEAKPQSLDEARQSIAKNSDLKCLFNRETALKRYLRKKWKCNSPLQTFGKERASAFLEAIIGAIYLSYDLCEARKFIINYFPISKVANSG